MSSSSLMSASLRDTNPSFGLKCKAYFYQTGILAVIIAFNIFGLLLNVAGSRIYLLALYVALRLLTPGGGNSAEKTPEGGVWRKFSEVHFFPFATMREYLQLTFGGGDDGDGTTTTTGGGTGTEQQQPLSHSIPKEFVEEEAKADAQFIFAAFPHGCNSDFRVLMDGILRDAMPNITERDNLRSLAASVLLFYIPLMRELCLWTGCINASRKYAELALDTNKSLLILPGGEAEQLMTTFGQEQVYLSKRKGFIKLAMRKGVPVVPIYVFGSSDSYYTLDWCYGLRYKLMKNFGICITLCCGLWGSMICPLPKKTTIVFGKPIRFNTKNKNNNNEEGPTPEELDAGHALFIKELTELFDEHKTRLGYGDRTLKVV